MNKKAQFRAGRITWMFNKSGSESERTRAFKNFPTETQKDVRRMAKLRPDEIPALAYIASNSEWALATSDRIIWSTPESLSFIEFTHLKDATVTNEDIIRSHGMLGLSTLILVKNSGETLKLSLEKGGPFSGFWNTLRMMARIVSDDST